MIRRQREPLRADRSRDNTGIYIVREGDEIGPYTREVAQSLLDEGKIEPNDLLKIGSAGRAFPAAMLLN